VQIQLLQFAPLQNMANHRDIIEEVDRAIIGRFGFPRTSHKFGTVTRHVVITSSSGETIESKDIGEPRELPITNEFRKGRGFLRIKLHMEGQVLQKVQIEATPDCNDAAITWMQMVKARIPEIVIEFDPS
jgi:hypothetical protein